MRKLQIAVIGSAGPEEYLAKKPDSRMYAAAEELGLRLAKAQAVVVNGGKGGVMESVSKGAKSAGGLTVAEVSGIQRQTSNRYVDVEIITGDLAFRGPSQLIGMSDAVISLGGGAGTLQEICVAYRLLKPIILLTGFGGWTDRCSQLAFLDERELMAFSQAKNPEEAVKTALTLATINLQKGTI